MTQKRDFWAELLRPVGFCSERVQILFPWRCSARTVWCAQVLAEEAETQNNDGENVLLRKRKGVKKLNQAA